jgi:hypothetical protein
VLDEITNKKGKARKIFDDGKMNEDTGLRI